MSEGVRLRLTKKEAELVLAYLNDAYPKTNARDRKRLANVIRKLEGEQTGGY